MELEEVKEVTREHKLRWIAAIRSIAQIAEEETDGSCAHIIQSAREGADFIQRSIGKNV